MKGALLGEPFPWSELDTALHQVEPAGPVFQLFNGGPLREEQYTDVSPSSARRAGGSTSAASTRSCEAAPRSSSTVSRTTR